jgi:hypothetical protein
MRYVGYKMEVSGDMILFDDEIRADDFFARHPDIEEDTLMCIRNINGRIELHVEYEDEPNPGDMNDSVYTPEENILDFVKFRKWNIA